MRPLLIAHRGFPFGSVENSEDSFRMALESGADVLETDVRLCADGHLVLSHDPDFRRFGCSQQPISSCTRGQLEKYRLRDDAGREARPLFLDDALRIFPDVRFNIDLKDKGARIVAAWIKLLDLDEAGNRCTTASFHEKNLTLFRRLRPGAPVSLARLSVLAQLVLTGLGRPRKPRSGESVMQLPERAGGFRIITPRRIELWHNTGWTVQVWTIDDEQDMRRLANWGIDGIITNRADRFQEVFV